MKAFLITPFTAERAGEAPDVFEALQRAIAEAARRAGVELVHPARINRAGAIMQAHVEPEIEEDCRAGAQRAGAAPPGSPASSRPPAVTGDTVLVYSMVLRNGGVVGRDIEIGNGGTLAWDATNVLGSLDRLRKYVEGQAGKASTWYLQRKELKAWFSRYMRLADIVATALGALFPIDAQLWPNMPSAAQSGPIPALLVGVAAALLGADRGSRRAGSGTSPPPRPSARHSRSSASIGCSGPARLPIPGHCRKAGGVAAAIRSCIEKKGFTAVGGSPDFSKAGAPAPPRSPHASTSEPSYALADVQLPPLVIPERKEVGPRAP